MDRDYLSAWTELTDEPGLRSKFYVGQVLTVLEASDSYIRMSHNELVLRGLYNTIGTVVEDGAF